MCGRFATFLPAEAIRALFRTTGAPNLPPSWNIAPSQGAMVVRRHPRTGERHLDVLRWGLIPSWERDPKGGRKPINARSETAARLPMFRAALAARRCLVPADAFYEWRADAGGRTPFAIARRDGAPMALAGLWEGWRDPAGEVVRSFAILTCAANETLRDLHARMPVVVEAPDWATWLGEDGTEPGSLLRPAATDVLRLWPVSRAVNNVRNDEPALLAASTPDPGGAGGADPA